MATLRLMISVLKLMDMAGRAVLRMVVSSSSMKVTLVTARAMQYCRNVILLSGSGVMFGSLSVVLSKSNQQVGFPKGGRDPAGFSQV